MEFIRVYFLLKIVFSFPSNIRYILDFETFFKNIHQFLLPFCFGHVIISSGWCDGFIHILGDHFGYGPLARYVKLWVAHVPGMPGTFFPQARVSDPDMHHGTCVTHVPWCMPGSLTSGFLWSRWRGKRSRHSRRMRNPQFYVSGKRPIGSSIERKRLYVMPSLIVGWTHTQNA